MSQLEMWLDVYKHHFDLYVKGVAFYLAAASTLAGLIYQQSITATARQSLSVVLTLFSFVTFAGSIVSCLFVRRLQADVDAIAAVLGIRSFPFSGANRVTILFAATGLVLTLVATLICVQVWHC